MTPTATVPASAPQGPKKKKSNSLLERFSKGFGSLIKFNQESDAKESLYKLDGCPRNKKV